MGTRKRGIPVNADVLRSMRIRIGMTQEELAILADVDVRTIRHAEQGAKIDLRTIQAINHALGGDFEQLTASSQGFSCLGARHLDVVRRWHDAYLDRDVNTILSLHIEDGIRMLPGTEGMPAAGKDFCGQNELREHLTGAFRIIHVTHVREDDFMIHGIDRFVFLRTTATIVYLPTGKSHTARHFNEFEFHHGKISRSEEIVDYRDFRKILSEAGAYEHELKSLQP